MMLHEAVMLEIYRQALTASELTSPRCQSRESNISAAALDARCPSNGSQCSGGQERSATPANTSHPSTPPAGLPLPATLAPAAAAALLPPQSAAMAAYFNAAAAAAQQNHLLLTNPLAAAASLVQHATQAHTPTTNQLPTTQTLQTDNGAADEPVLDFSTKHRRETERESEEDEEVDDAKMDDDDNGDLSNARATAATVDTNSPLDLSVGRKRESTGGGEEQQAHMRKILRTTMPHNNYKIPAAAAAASNWVPTINPYLAAVAAASLSPPKSPLSPLEWSGKHKLMPNEATKALEKMTEMTRLGSATDNAELPQHHRQGNMCNSNTGAVGGTGVGGGGGGGRHSAWQSHWLNKGADAVRDVFTCVWCKQSFPTLASLTTHMKETQHCGVSMPPTGANNVSTHSGGGGRGEGGSNGNQTTQSTAHHLQRHTSAATAGSPIAPTTGVSSPASVANAANSAAATNKSDLNLLIKESMPLPRKLVRGQDVWLGKGAEQTREILKCMWCGQSFRSLAEMTSHMQETQHYTNIISQEQIISWKSTDDKNSNSGSAHPTGAPSTSPVVTSPTSGAATFLPTSPSNNSTASATVSAVLTCKVCDQAFPTLKELSNHMMKNSHYTEHMMRPGGGGGGGGGSGLGEQLTASPTAQATAAARRGRQMREKRKKSLPVRKLLELERDYKNSLDGALKPLRDFAVSTKITCERCGEKVETALFVEHLRKCLAGNLFERNAPRQQGSVTSGGEPLRPTMNTTYEHTASPHTPTNRSDGRKTTDSNKSHASTRPEILCPLPKESADKSNNSTPSVLNALEQLIEKSFDTRARSGGASHSSNGGNGSQRSTPLGSSILKRLGIDDTVDYTKPLIDPQTMHYMRPYSNYSARDRSASESSSISERCNSRIESFTPERMSARQTATPRLTPEERLSVAVEAQGAEERERETANEGAPAQLSDSELLHIKTEPVDTSEAPQELTTNDNPTQTCESMQKISVKKEFNMVEHAEVEEEEERQSNDSSHYKPQSQSACSRAASPSASERSITPKSSTSSGLADKRYPAAATASSLTALSSMFDNLHNMSSGSSNAQLQATTENLLSAVEPNNNNNNTNKKGNSNPLAALEKLCEKTEKPSIKARSSSNGINHNNQLTGNMMAFSWACNDAVQATNASESAMIKCTQCDAVFSSKGAYRHHFSKVHYVKDEGEVGQTLTSTIKSPLMASSPKSAATSPKSASKSPVGSVGSMSAPIINPYNESSQSKFLKYTELAKQLSSKNA